MSFHSFKLPLLAILSLPSALQANPPAEPIEPKPEVNFIAADTSTCPTVGGTQKLNGRCTLGNLTLKVPAGFKLKGMQLKAQFATHLDAVGEQAGAVLRLYTRKRTYSASHYIRIETDNKLSLPVEDLSVSLDIPDFGSCTEAVNLSLPVRSSFLTNFSYPPPASADSPTLRYLSIELIEKQKQFERLPCEPTGD